MLAKTDRVGARILAGMGRMLPLEATAPPDPDRTRLADFLRRRTQLVKISKAEKVRRHDAGQPAILRETETMIALLDQRVADMDRELRQANEILRKASAYFAMAEIDRRSKNRQFRAPAPNMLWVSDFTRIATWKGFVYVAFVIDA